MLPLQITMKNIPTCPTLDNQIRQRSERLIHYCDNIISCRVVIELPKKHKHRGKLFSARIDVTVPGKEFVSTYKHNENAHLAVRDAFNAMQRQLEEHSKKRHGRVKTHNDVEHGYVTKIMPQEGYGFIAGDDGNEYYFNLTNVSHPAFARLSIGDAVEYMPEYLSEGRHAHHVVRERRHQQTVA